MMDLRREMQKLPLFYQRALTLVKESSEPVMYHHVMSKDELDAVLADLYTQYDDHVCTVDENRSCAAVWFVSNISIMSDICG